MFVDSNKILKCNENHEEYVNFNLNECILLQKFCVKCVIRRTENKHNLCAYLFVYIISYYFQELKYKIHTLTFRAAANHTLVF
jgi:hypothetical protein